MYAPPALLASSLMVLPLVLWMNDPLPVEVHQRLVCGARGIRCGEEADVVPCGGARGTCNNGLISYPFEKKIGEGAAGQIKDIYG